MRFRQSGFHEAIERVQGLGPLFIPYQIHDTTWLPSFWARLYDRVRQRWNREYSSELYCKLSAAFHQKDADHVIVTIIRLDNASDGDHSDFFYKPIDRLWRSIQGWSSPLELCFNDEAYGCLRIPSNAAIDTLQFEISSKQVPSEVKSVHSTEIPENLFYTWNDPSLTQCPQVLQKTIAVTAMLNPSFKVHYFSPETARSYIESKESPNVLEAYDRLIPRAFKVDFWRYVVLYHEGGVYLDAKVSALYPLHAFLPSDGGLLVNDIRGAGLLNGILAMPKGSKLMRSAIDGIVAHVSEKFYGNSPLDVSGPNHLYKCFNSLSGNERAFYKRIQFDLTGILVRDGSLPVLAVHNGEYRRALSRPGMASHYEEIWNHRAVYGEETAILPSESKFQWIPLAEVALTILFLIFFHLWRRSHRNRLR